MKNYSTVIFTLSYLVGGFMGLVGLIQSIMLQFADGNAIGIALTIVFSAVLIVFYGIIPFIFTFVILFLVGLPFYGVYKLFEKKPSL